ILSNTPPETLASSVFGPPSIDGPIVVSLYADTISLRLKGIRKRLVDSGQPRIRLGTADRGKPNYRARSTTGGNDSHAILPPFLVGSKRNYPQTNEHISHYSRSAGRSLRQLLAKERPTLCHAPRHRRCTQ